MAGTADDVRWDYGFNKVNQLTKKTLSGGSHLALYKWQPSSKKNDIYQSNGLNQYSNIAGNSLGSGPINFIGCPFCSFMIHSVKGV